MGDEQAFGAALRQVKEAGLIPEDQMRLCPISHFFISRYNSLQSRNSRLIAEL